jgi:hypothetical protein
MKIVLANQFKNEANRLKEWILFYKEQGIKDFVLMNDNSTDDFKDQISKIRNVNVSILNSEEQTTEYKNSENTQNYEGNVILANSISLNFKKIMQYIQKEIEEDVVVGYFDVDEFVFSETSTIQESLEFYKNFSMICVFSYEVNSNLFDFYKPWVTLQTTRSFSDENRLLGSRKHTVKTFCNLNHQDKNLFFTISPSHLNYGGIIHTGGTPGSYWNPNNIEIYPEFKTENKCIFSDTKKLKFLHYRKPTYHLDHNIKYFDKDYPIVERISLKAKQNEKT